MTTSSRALALAVLVAGLAAPAAARAEPSAPSAADLETARDLFRQGKELRAKGDLAGALEKLKAAHAYAQTPITAVELGRTHVARGELMEAREVFLSVARMRVQPDESENAGAARREAAETADELRGRLATVEVEAAEGDAVTLDGAPAQIVGGVATRKVNPGKHDVVVRRGDVVARREVTLAEGGTERVSRPAELAAAPAVPTSTATQVPAERPAADAPRGGSLALPLAAFGVAAAGVGVGTVFGLVALGKGADLEAGCAGTACPPALEDTYTSGRTAATISTVGFVVGGAAAAAGAALLVFRRSPPRGAARITPFVAPTGAGFHGTF